MPVQQKQKQPPLESNADVVDEVVHSCINAAAATRTTLNGCKRSTAPRPRQPSSLLRRGVLDGNRGWAVM